MTVLTCVFAGALLGVAMAVDAWLVGPWIAALVPQPDAGQRETLALGAAARRVSLVWMVLAVFLVGHRVLEYLLARPVRRLAAEVSRRRVSGTAWAGATPERVDEIGVIAREFGETYDELMALRGSQARADALEDQLVGLCGVDSAVRQLAVSTRQLAVAIDAGEDQLEARLSELTDQVAALSKLTHDVQARRSEDSAAFSLGSAPAPEFPVKPAGLPLGPLPEAEPC